MNEPEIKKQAQIEAEEQEKLKESKDKQNTKQGLIMFGIVVVLLFIARKLGWLGF